MAGSYIGDTLEAFGEKMKTALQKAIEEKKVTASRVLKQSIFFETKVFGNRYVFKLGFLPPADQYAPAVDTGAIAHQAPIQPIIEWINRKPEVKQMALSRISGKRTRTLKNLKNRTVKKGMKQRTTEQLVRSFAWAVATNIKKKGTIKRFGYGGSGFWSDTVTDNEINALKKELSKAMGKEVSLMIGEVKKAIKGQG